MGPLRLVRRPRWQRLGGPADPQLRLRVPAYGGGIAIDVETETVITRPVAEVSAYAADPINAPEWYDNIESAAWETDPPLRVGSRVAFDARFMGRQLTHTYEVVELVPEARLVMRTADGPFPVETTYTWVSTAEGYTRMTLRNRGEPTGFFKLVAPIMVGVMRRADNKHLDQLKTILQGV